MDDSAGVVAVAIATPGATAYALLLALCLLPLALLLAAARHPRYRTLPAPLSTGLPLFAGLAGGTAGLIGLWLISANGAWRDDDTFYLRASRAFRVELPLAQLRVDDARPLTLAQLCPEGRIRTPGYAAGWYRDSAQRRVFLLYAGAPLTRIPTDGGFDLAVGIAEPQALRPRR